MKGRDAPAVWGTPAREEPFACFAAVLSCPDGHVFAAAAGVCPHSHRPKRIQALHAIQEAALRGRAGD
jgi:hypothetical protein